MKEHEVPDEAGAGPDAVKCLGKWALMALIMNSVIGAGIFGLPGNIAKAVGGFALWAYLLGAGVDAIIVAIVAELSSQFDKPGGAYLYVSRAFGLGLGTLTGWFSWLARTTTAAAIANLLMSSLAKFWPPVSQPLFRSAGLALIVATLAAINIRSTRGGARTSSTLLVLKLLPLLTLVVAGLFLWDRGTAPQSATAVPDWRAWMDALIAMVFAFGGFEGAMIAGGNIRNPREDAPRAAFGALLATSVLYSSLHLVVMRAVPNMASSERTLSDAAAVYLGGAGESLIALAAVISTLGSLSATAFSAPRLTESMAHDGVFPQALAWKHPKSQTPWVSIVLWALLVIALAIYGTFFWNVVLSVAARLVVYFTMCISLLKLRRKQPDRLAWRAPFGVAIPIAGILICVLLATRLNMDHVILMLAVAIAAAATRLIRWRGKSEAGVDCAPH